MAQNRIPKPVHSDCARFGMWGSALVMLCQVSMAVAAEPVPRTSVDNASVQALVAHTPEAAKLLVQGESALYHGRLGESSDALRRASELAPKNPLIARRYCQVLARQGRQPEVIDACHRAMMFGASPADLRATVGALLKGGKPPNVDQFAEAIMSIYALQRFGQAEVNLHAAECDLAEVRGDWEDFTRSLARLEELDKDGLETRRAAAVLGAVRAGHFVTMGWLVILSLLAGTLAHAVHSAWAEAKRRAKLQPVTLLVAFCCASVLVVKPTAAETMTVPPAGLSKLPIDHLDPESSVPSEQEKNRSPLEFGYFLMDLSDRGSLATKMGDYTTAVRYFRAMAKAVPDSAAGFSKLCEVYELTKETERAIPFCRAAMALSGAKVDDHFRLVRLLLAKPGALSEAELSDLDAIVSHLRAQLPPGATAADNVECDVGLRVKDLARLKRCTERLAMIAPSEPQTISYRWAYAIMRHDYQEASTQLRFAKASGLSPDAIRAMQEETSGARPLWLRLLTNRWVWGVVGIMIVVGGVDRWLSRRGSRRVATAALA
jgi:tetratricopeptide (TPR) repeat protein